MRKGYRESSYGGRSELHLHSTRLINSTSPCREPLRSSLESHLFAEFLLSVAHKDRSFVSPEAVRWQVKRTQKIYAAIMITNGHHESKTDNQSPVIETLLLPLPRRPRARRPTRNAVQRLRNKYFAQIKLYAISAIADQVSSWLRPDVNCLAASSLWTALRAIANCGRSCYAALTV